MNQTQSMISSNNYTLINFNIPTYLKKNFDSLVKFKRVSRTSILNQLIDRYVRFELDQIEKDNRINSLMSDVEKRNQKSLKKEIKKTINEIKEDKLPPSIPLQIDDVVNERSWSDYQRENWEESY
jgi:hypothetical protein